jgi:nitric oxide dioxygenase
MTPAQMRLLQSSLALIAPVADQIGASMYQRLGERASAVWTLFGSRKDVRGKILDSFAEFVAVQHRSLLTLPVTASANTEVSIPVIAGLAARHASWGVRPEHFPAIKEALLWSLNERLGQRLDAETAAVWSLAYDLMTEAMIRVMKSEATPPDLPDGSGRARHVEEDASLEMLFRE